MPTEAVSRNFGFLRAYEPQLDRLGALAERYFADDPSTCLIKLRQFGEELARQVAARSGLLATPDELQSDLLRRLKFERAVPPEVLDLFHQVRIVGNRATHHGYGDHRDALTTLKIARQLAIWFHRTFGKDTGFKPGPFVPPTAPQAASESLMEELEQLRAQRAQLLGEAEKAREAAEAARVAHETAEARARRIDEERDLWAVIAQEAEDQKNAALADLIALQSVAAQATPQQKARRQQQAEQAAKGIDLDEAATRAIIDEQLRIRGWEADTKVLRYSQGARPAKGRAMAIAEWPTASGPADYALFYGLPCLGTVEAKRERKNVSAAVDQSERYARDIILKDGEAKASGGPWDAYRVPFVFATNGRPYLKQIETESGIWFRDTRKATHHRRALNDWPTPDGLKARLEIDIEAAQEALKTQPMVFGFPLRPYQQQAIEAVERSIADGLRSLLVAMATGTGKTKLAIALLFRLLNAKRFRRVCFVVDRSALGQQSGGEFSSTKVVGTKTFADIFDLKGLDAAGPEPETKVHICTIQGLVRRVLYNADPADVPPIDQYDLIVIDECHRGYLLDRELSDGELSFRSEADYISKYRRVLEHFDAVKIGLTATPALHTVQIFGDPVYTYSYREAVVDGYLIDHEPPIQITTALSQAGIHFGKGEQIELLETKTGRIDLAHVPDQIDFEVEAFNKQVVTVNFNTVVAEELTKHIDPDLPGKTLIFAATDAHADFDAVDLYPHLQSLTDMRPVVVNPSISLEQLFEELAEVETDAHREEIRDQILVKLRRRLAKLCGEAREQYEANAGETPEATLKRLAEQPLDTSAAWIAARPGLGRILDREPEGYAPRRIPISSHDDRIAEVVRGYGSADKPEDFLDGFTSYVRNNVNKIAALTVVVQRPRELTRAQLRELRLALDTLGYSDANLRRAWQDARNEEIAASIIGFVRQAALGDALIPFDERVRAAMQRILAKHPWSDPQRKWLKRIAEQIEREIVVDRSALDREPFQAYGGFSRLNKVFDGQLEAVLGELNEALWEEAG